MSKKPVEAQATATRLVKAVKKKPVTEVETRQVAAVRRRAPRILPSALMETKRIWFTERWSLNLTGNDDFLRIYATSNSNDDITLVVNSSNGQWICNDDSYGGTNPSVDLRNVRSGQIDVWVGSYRSGVQSRSVLHVTELEGNHP